MVRFSDLLDGNTLLNLCSVSQGEAEASMDRLCDTVNKALQSNAELSMRLRNVENMVDPKRAQIPKAAGSTSSQEQVASGANRQSLDSDQIPSAYSNGSASIRSGDQSGTPRLSTDRDDNIPKVSAFEELLHRSRVYRHASGSHSESSLVDDGRSTLAISICSSLTLGEVSRISVYALPVYASELSNAEVYHFGKLPEDDNVVYGATSTLVLETAKTGSSSKNAWWKRIGRSPRQSKVEQEVVQSSSKLQKREGGPVFGVALDTSTRFANVAMSLLDENGESYIYGYAPIVVMKCGVFLKEKGQ